MRYFYTGNATRPYRSGRLTFTFEVCGGVGGQRFGFLEAEGDAAEALASLGPPVREITAEEYGKLKKNKQSGEPRWLVSLPSLQGQSKQNLSAALAGNPPASMAAITVERVQAAESPPSNEPVDIDDAVSVAPVAEPPPDLELVEPGEVPKPKPKAKRKRRG